MLSSHRRQAFTLLEVVICICLVVLFIGLALPSLSGQTRMRKLQEAYDRFDAFVTQAQQQSAKDGKPYVLAWTKKGTVRLIAAEATDDTGNKIPDIATFVPAENEHFVLERRSSLTEQPAPRWTFWPTGNCEPVNVGYESPVGTWAASFNPLSCRGTIDRMIAP